MALTGIDPARWRKHAATFAAMLALVLNVLVPQGFMASSSAGQPGLVLCTGSGPVLIASDLIAKTSKTPGAPASTDAGACAFAGHGAAPPLTSAPLLASEATVWKALVHARLDRAPANLALAAPPPQAIGPPQRRA